MRLSTLALIASIGLAGTARADANKPDVVDAAMAYVVPPGLETVLADMLGGNDALAGGCRLVTARVVSSWIKAAWQCEGGVHPVAFLQHPSVGGEAVFETPKLKVKRAGEVAWPAGFAEALEARLLARGSKFDWQATAQNAVIPAGTFKAPTLPEGTVGTQNPAGLMNGRGEAGWVEPKPAVKIVWTYVVLGALAALWVITRIVRWRRAIRARAEAQAAETNVADAAPPAA